MALSVNTNIAAMNANRNLQHSNDAMATSLERLSSGYRINRAADDAAGLAISEGLRSQIGGLTQAVRNTQDATSVVQTAEGALDETTSILQRMRDLSVQASNDGSLNDDAKASIQKEMSQLSDELTRISTTTNFNGTNLLDGNYSGTFQVGADSGQTITVKIGSAGKGMDATGLGVAGINVTGVASNATTGTVTNATSTTAGVVALAGAADWDDDANIAQFDDLNGTISAGGKTFDLSTVKYDAGDDAAARLTKLNTAASAALGLATGSTPFAVGTTATDLEFTGAANAATDSATDIAAATPTFTQASGASEAIDKIDEAIKTVSAQRADLGAYQNRFEHTVNNLNVAIENTTASESRIRDTDMATEMTAYSSNQVLVQAGTSMLSQANSSTQSILSLLQG